MPPSSRQSAEPSTSALLLSALSAYSTLAQTLFATIESPSSSSSRTITASVPDAITGKTWSTRTIPSILQALEDVDKLLAQRIKTARQHAVNQARIERMQRQAKARSRQSRRAILELSGMKNDLQDMLDSSRGEIKAIRRAERAPLGHKVILSYAHRLAKYTSAPPGYQLPQIAAPPTAKAETAGDTKAEEKKLTLGPEYNQYAKRAAAYYDPAMPSMPQEMPFPSDAMMRQGVLNSADMLNGAQMALAPPPDAVEDEEVQDEPQAVSAYTDFYSQQQQQRDADDDAFDLDLN